MSETTQAPCRIDDVSDADYFGGRFDRPVPRLSQSTAKTLLELSPLHAHHNHVMLGGNSTPPTPSMDRGTLLHRLLLGSGADVVSVDAEDWRTKAAREARAAAQAEGKVAVLQRELAVATAGMVSVRNRLAERHGIDLDGSSEVTVLWDSDGVACKGRIDHWPKKPQVIYDLKTTACAAPGMLAHNVFKMGHDIQAAAYTEAAEAITGEPHEYVLLYVEQEAPYGITVARMDGEYMAIGRRRWSAAVATWGRCLRDNDWPDYGATDLVAPAWVLERSEELLLTEDDDDANL